jgi:hypothetical protein
MYGLRGSISGISRIDQHHAPTASPKHHSGTKTGGPTADNHDIEGIGHDLPGLMWLVSEFFEPAGELI